MARMPATELSKIIPQMETVKGLSRLERPASQSVWEPSIAESTEQQRIALLIGNVNQLELTMVLACTVLALQVPSHIVSQSQLRAALRLEAHEGAAAKPEEHKKEGPSS